MKSGIHPTYYPTAKVTCNCGMSFEVGSTQSEIRVEVCSNCHPFYTGKQNLIDTAGRVDKFEARRKQAQTYQAEKAKSQKDSAQPKSEKKSGRDALKELRKTVLQKEVIK
ncbi:50S ribosomal protein L31 [Candidatus Berkelbacteria bacterium]|nr:50S ribosomal protein L31 [Candidatus Berkelbacteria bacterium]